MQEVILLRRTIKRYFTRNFKRHVSFLIFLYFIIFVIFNFPIIFYKIMRYFQSCRIFLYYLFSNTTADISDHRLVVSVREFIFYLIVINFQENFYNFWVIFKYLYYIDYYIHLTIALCILPCFFEYAGRTESFTFHIEFYVIIKKKKKYELIGIYWNRFYY